MMNCMAAIDVIMSPLKWDYQHRYNDITRTSHIVLRQFDLIQHKTSDILFVTGQICTAARCHRRIIVSSIRLQFCGFGMQKKYLFSAHWWALPTCGYSGECGFRRSFLHFCHCIKHFEWTVIGMSTIDAFITVAILDNNNVIIYTRIPMMSKLSDD